MSKAPEKTDANANEDAPVAKSKKKLIIVIASVLILAVAGGGAALFIGKKKSTKTEKHAEEPAKAPVFMSLDQFVVNLQSESGDKYLQIQMTLQAKDEVEVALIKANTPQIRSRLLMLLSSKNADDILTPAGKEKLIKDIKTQINLPFSPKGEPQKVSDIFFTSFIVQ
jgi:flagellar FliL protein